MENKWISIKDDYPNFGERVLVVLNGDVFNKQIEIADLIVGNDWYFGDNWSNQFASKFVTHWMELPDAPVEL